MRITLAYARADFALYPEKAEIAATFRAACVPRCGEYIHISGTTFRVEDVDYLVSNEPEAGIDEVVCTVCCACIEEAREPR